MTALHAIAWVEAITILVLAEPVLNRMSACAPFAIRLAFHLMAIGSALRIYHLLTGHVPSWSAVVQIGGLAIYLVVEQCRRRHPAPKVHHPLRRATDSEGGP